jgi:hypothetical protein
MATTETLQQAKTQAIAKYLPDAKPAPEFAALAATTSRSTNVVGVGIGPKIRKGKQTKTMSIRFYVEKKVPLKAVPKSDLLPTKVNGVPTDVVETGRLYAQVPIAQTRMRPTLGGCSIGFHDPSFVMAGTLGCLVRDPLGVYILSNNHVIANENALPIGSPIFQPGTLDGGVPTKKDMVARLTRFVRIRKLPTNNHVDAAIAKLVKPSIARPTILPKVGQLGSATPVPAAVGMRVHKHGRTTGYTTGRVIDVAADLNITYDFGVARFVDQIVIVGDTGSFSDSGDSGSLIVRRAGNRATGLLFAGSASHTIANHIGRVLTALKVQIVQ